MVMGLSFIVYAHIIRVGAFCMEKQVVGVVRESNIVGLSDSVGEIDSGVQAVKAHPPYILRVDIEPGNWFRRIIPSGVLNTTGV